MSLQDNYERSTESARLSAAERSERVEKLRDELIQQMLEQDGAEANTRFDTLTVTLKEDVCQSVLESDESVVLEMLGCILKSYDCEYTADADRAMTRFTALRIELLGRLRERIKAVCTELAEKEIGK